MSRVNWGLISTGFEFQALCGSLLGLEYPVIEQFSAVGPDRGVDAYLPVESTIYQYKHHREPGVAKVKQDALAELSKVSARKEKGDRYWPGAKKWVLVTNCEASPQLREMWEKDVVPAFAKEGLVAELLTREQLDSLLIKHPTVIQAYFEKANRAFITLNEAIEALKARRIQSQDLENAYLGRESELGTFGQFLGNASKSLLLVTGPGGVGKTRFLVECAKIAAESQLSVYWANTETMESSSDWARGIPTGKNVVLCIDEPARPQTVRILLEQIQAKGSVFSAWKVVVSVRSQNAQVIEALSLKREEALRARIDLLPLKESTLATVATALLLASDVASKIGSRMTEISGAVAKASQGYPVWTVVATRLIQDTGSFVDLPKDHWDIAKAHVSQAVGSIPAQVSDPRKTTTILNWLSLWGEVNIEDQVAIEFLKIEIEEKESHRVVDILDALVDRKVVYAIGRIRRIKPDVIRDYLLLALLVSERGKKAAASSYSKDLCGRSLDEGNPIPHLDLVIGSLNHVELLQKLNGHPVELLTPIISELTKFAVKGTSVQQFSALELAKKFAYSRPKELLEICSSIRKTPTEPSEVSSNFWGKRSVEHKAALLELPWAILEAARYALEQDVRVKILDELVHLAEHERTQSSQNPIQPNDGKRAYQVIEKIIFNGPGFYVRFDQEGEAVANRILDSWKSGQPVSVEAGYALKSLVGALISVEREHTTFQKGSITINRFLINPDHPVSEIRSRLLEKLWNLLAKSTHESARLVVLDLLQDNHRDTQNGTARAKTRPGSDRYEKETLADLSRIQVILVEPWMSGIELRGAKKIWDWHLRFDSRGEYKTLAEECEKKFLSRPNSPLLARVFEWNYQQESDATEAARELAEQAAKDDTGKAIEQLVAQAEDFSGNERFWHGAPLVSTELGKKILSAPGVNAFVWANLGSKNRTVRLFAAAVLSQHIRSLREVAQLKEQELLLEKAKNTVEEDGLYDLMLNLYFRPSFGLTGELNAIDRTFFRSHLDRLLGQEDRLELIQIVAKFLPLGWDAVKADTERCLSGLQGKLLASAVSMVIDSIQMQLYRDSKLPFSRADAKWIFDLLVNLPQIDDCGSKVEWDLQQLAQKSGFKYSIAEFAVFLEKRIQLTLAASDSEARFQVLPSSVMFDFFQFVDTTTDAAVDKSEVEKVMRRLLELNEQPYPVGYYLSEWIASLDPQGDLVPDLVLEKLAEAKKANNIDSVVSWARYAGEYLEGTQQWRKIALSVAEFAVTISDPKERNGLLWSLSYRDMESWSGSYGEFHPRWQEAVDREEKRLSEEPNAHLKEFFQLKLQAAKSDLEREKIQHVEEHSNE